MLDPGTTSNRENNLHAGRCMQHNTRDSPASVLPTGLMGMLR
jgi:hypothetical protein